jgi:deoxyribonucleoside regulator
MGNICPAPDSYDAVELSRTIATKWAGSFLMLNTPAFLPDAKTHRAIYALKEIQEVLKKAEQADLVFVGVGTVDNSVFVERGSLTAADAEVLRKAGAVGEILGHYFDATGKECATPLRDRTLSLDLDKLRKIKNISAIVTGADRAKAIIAAVRGGVLTSVIVDEPCADALLAEIKKN